MHAKFEFRPFRMIYLVAICGTAAYYFGIWAMLLVALATIDVEIS